MCVCVCVCVYIYIYIYDISSLRVNVNFNAKLNLFLRLFNCVSIGAKTLITVGLFYGWLFSAAYWKQQMVYNKIFNTIPKVSLSLLTIS